MSNDEFLTLDDAKYVSRHAAWFTTETLEKAQQVIRDCVESDDNDGPHLAYWTITYNLIETELEQRDKRQASYKWLKMVSADGSTVYVPRKNS